MEKLIEKWDRYGILEGVPEAEKWQLVNKLEYMVRLIIEQTNLNINDTISTVAIPIVRRIFMGVTHPVSEDVVRNRGFNVQHLYDSLINFHERHWNTFEEYQYPAYNTMDYEAEFCAIFCEDYLGICKYGSPYHLVKLTPHMKLKYKKWCNRMLPFNGFSRWLKTIK